MWWILVLTLLAFVIDVVCSVALLGREPATPGGSRIIEFPHYRRVAGVPAGASTNEEGDQRHCAPPVAC